jgi:hypothetical protein
MPTDERYYFVVLKQPVDMAGAMEIVGIFQSQISAGVACAGAGTYVIAKCAVNRIYKSGTLLEATRIVVAA